MMHAMDMNRRMLMQHLLALAGVSVLPGGAEALAAAVEGGTRQLDPAHYALLVAVADTIIPKTDTSGAVEVGAPQVVDAVLGSWASPARRAELTAALDRIDALGKASGGGGFASLSPAKRFELLAAHDAAALNPPAVVPVDSTTILADPQQGKAEQNSSQSGSLIQGAQLADPAYAKLKELIVVAFYFSESALTHDLRYEHSPGEWKPSIPVTPDTRAEGGVALL